MTFLPYMYIFPETRRDFIVVMHANFMFISFLYAKKGPCRNIYNFNNDGVINNKIKILTMQVL